MHKSLRFIIGASLIALAVAYLIVTAIENTAEYYLTVSEVQARHAALRGQMLRVAGRVKPGTISWDPASLTLGFEIVPPPAADGTAQAALRDVTATGSPSFRVICKGQPKPDMFAANRDVIVEGRLASGGVIEARQVLTSCPSKYVPKRAK